MKIESPQLLQNRKYVHLYPSLMAQRPLKKTPSLTSPSPMAQRPHFTHSGVNRFHHEQAIDDLSKQVRLLSLLAHAQHERLRMEREKAMFLFMMKNRVPNGYFLPPPSYGLIGQLPVRLLPESKGTGAFIPDYNIECRKYNEIVQQQHKPQIKRAKASGKKSKKDKVSCHTSPEALLPKEWTY